MKEQTSGLYVEKLAEQGFIASAYDASHYGESGGGARLYEVPGDRVEDIRCAVDHVSKLPQVAPDRIGALGICAGGGYTVNAAQTEARIKAVGTVSAFDVGSARREEAGEPLLMINFVPMSAEEITQDTPELYREGYDYYCTPRGQHPNAPGKYVFTASTSRWRSTRSSTSSRSLRGLC
ncbi:alpha/beta hydrolase [Streptomyces sp. NBC_01314]|uniref:alpha/beta hydrolase n=1 Tax=Streptomyces sp. NBC_01314 TaxID=2903821 RepID=UPI00308809C9|nr:alpha/beta hydrolase [Streptomyces sp. NBC_01314]